MGFFISGQTNDIAHRRLIRLICEPHQIDPKSVQTIEMSGWTQKPKYRIKFLNGNKQLCVIQVIGNLAMEIEIKKHQPKKAGAK